MFSLGCIFYKMIYNINLFHGKKEDEIVAANKICKYDFPG